MMATFASALRVAPSRRLEAARQQSDLVEEKRTAVGGLEKPGLRLPGIGEGAALVAK
jgi:hypothetical protein